MKIDMKIIAFCLLLASFVGIILIIYDINKPPTIIIKESCTTNYIEIEKPKEFDVLYNKTEKLLKSVNSFTPKISKNLSNIIVAVITNSYIFNIDPELILTFIYCESGFDVYSHNSYGARGLMQIVPKWMKYELSQNNWKVDDCYDIDVNIFLGTQQLRQFLIIDKGNLGKAIYRYNGCKVRKIKDNLYSIPEEGYLHLIKVMNIYYWYKNNNQV